MSRRVAVLTEVLQELAEARVAVADIGLRRPTLDDVFLHLTGHRTALEPGAVPVDRDGTVTREVAA